MNWLVAQISRNGTFTREDEEGKKLCLIAGLALTRAGFEVGFLTESHKTLFHGKQRIVIKPQLYEYLFVRGPEPHRIYTMPGLSGLLLNADGEWAEVADHELEKYRAQEKDKPKLRTLPEGTRVEISDGPFKYYQAIVGDTKPSRARKGFVVVELPAFDNRPVELYMRQVERV